MINFKPNLLTKTNVRMKLTELEQEKQNKIKAHELVIKFIKSSGEKPTDYDEVFYNKSKSIGFNAISYMEDLAENVIESYQEQSKESEWISVKDAFEFTQWMSGIVTSNYMSGGNWYCSDGQIRTTEQLYKSFTIIKSKQSKLL